MTEHERTPEDALARNVANQERPGDTAVGELDPQTGGGDQVSAPWKHSRSVQQQLTADGTIGKIDTTAAQAILDATRKRAEGWRTGAAATLGLIFATVAIKGPGEGIGAFKWQERNLLAALVTVSVVTGFIGLWKMLRAANGPSWLDKRIKQHAVPHDAARLLRRAAAASYDLRVGQGFWIFSVALFAVSVGLTWFMSPE